MADLDTASKRTSSVGLLLGWLLAPPIPDGTLAQGDRQHVSFSNSGILAAGAAALAFIQDLNTRMLVYLRDYYSVTGGDLSTLSVRYMAGLTTGDATAKFRKIETDATAAMS